MESLRRQLLTTTTAVVVAAAAAAASAASAATVTNKSQIPGNGESLAPAADGESHQRLEGREGGPAGLIFAAAAAGVVLATWKAR